MGEAQWVCVEQAQWICVVAAEQAQGNFSGQATGSKEAMTEQSEAQWEDQAVLWERQEWAPEVATDHGDADRKQPQTIMEKLVDAREAEMKLLAGAKEAEMKLPLDAKEAEMKLLLQDAKEAEMELQVAGDTNLDRVMGYDYYCYWWSYNIIRMVQLWVVCVAVLLHHDETMATMVVWNHRACRDVRLNQMRWCTIGPRKHLHPWCVCNDPWTCDSYSNRNRAGDRTSTWGCRRCSSVVLLCL